MRSKLIARNEQGGHRDLDLDKERAVLDLSREKDPKILRQAALLLEHENRKLIEQIMALTQQLSELRGQSSEQLKLQLAEIEQKLQRVQQQLFGKKSERRERDSHSEDEPEPAQRGHGPREQKQLRIIEQPHELDIADQTCTSCGGTLEEWAGQEEVSEEIHVIRREFVTIKHVRKKYHCRCGGCIETAPAPQKLFPGARYSIDFAIEIAVNKYAYHLPLARQVVQMTSEGLVVDTQTLWDQLYALSRHVSPAWDRLHQYCLSAEQLHADETRWRLMRTGKKKKRGGESSENDNCSTPRSGEENKTCQVWCLVTNSAAYYRIEDGRGLKAGERMLGGYRGIVMCDCYTVYKSLEKAVPGLVLAHCWAHARRRFHEIRESFPEQVEEVLELIGELYAIERTVPKGDSADNLELRAQLRNERSRTVIASIKSWCQTMQCLPESTLAKAIRYVGDHWTGLTRFLDDPRIPLDNNAAERANRGPVVGRKNHYGSRSRRGLEVAAIFYSLIESSRLCGLDPYAYLREAVHAALRGEVVPLPHELRERAAGITPSPD